MLYILIFRYSQILMLILQGIGAKEPHSIPAQKAWTSLNRDVLTYKGISYITQNCSINIHLYHHAWFDFRNRRDAYSDYFENSINATKVHKMWSLDYLKPKFPKSYSENCWGVSDSDSIDGLSIYGRLIGKKMLIMIVFNRLYLMGRT